jgi:hypothetical protein
MIRRQAWIATLGAVALLTLGTGTASAATVENGNFESGDLEGWDVDSFALGGWFEYEGELSPLRRGSEFGALRRGLTPLPAPPQGQFGAASQQASPSAAFLSQVVKLERRMRHKLKFKLAYRNFNTGAPRGGIPGFHTPNHFRFGKAAAPNQQFRMDVMKPDAPINSAKAKHILERVYITERGDPNSRNYRTVKEDLTQHAGEKVRLRFGFVVTEAPLNVGVDAVKIKSKDQR